MNYTPEITKMITISSTHISMDSMWKLLNGEIEGLTTYPKGEYGIFIYIDDSVKLEDIKTNQTLDLYGIVNEAMSNHCDVICLDRDGPILDYMAKYNTTIGFF